MDLNDLHASLDAARVLAARLKPLLGAPDVFEAAIKAQADLDASQASLAALEARKEALAVEVAQAEHDVVATRQAFDAERGRMAQELGSLAEDVHTARNKAQTDVLAAEVAAQNQRATLEAETAAQKVALQAEIAALEATRDELRKQVDEAKEKFRALVG